MSFIDYLAQTDVTFAFACSSDSSPSVSSMHVVDSNSYSQFKVPSKSPSESFSDVRGLKGITHYQSKKLCKVAELQHRLANGSKGKLLLFSAK